MYSLVASNVEVRDIIAFRLIKYYKISFRIASTVRSAQVESIAIYIVDSNRILVRILYNDIFRAIRYSLFNQRNTFRRGRPKSKQRVTMISNKFIFTTC